MSAGQCQKLDRLFLIVGNIFLLCIALETKLIGSEIKGILGAATVRREGQNCLLYGENGQCADWLRCLIQVKTLLTGNEILLEYGQNANGGCSRHRAGIDRGEFVRDDHSCDVGRMKYIRWNRNWSTRSEREDARCWLFSLPIRPYR